MGRPSKHGGFDFTSQMRQLCRDIAGRHPDLNHIDFDRIAVSFSRTKKLSPYGIYASLTPMRFEDGARAGKRRGRLYGVQSLLSSDGTELLYILSFYLPRFMDTGFREKLITIFHELWHISPHFNGDLRRHPGRCYVHTHSQEKYDEQMGELVDQWLAQSPPEPLYGFLHYGFDELQHIYGRVYGLKIPHPKLIPIT